MLRAAAVERDRHWGSLALLGAVSAMFAGYLGNGIISRLKTYIFTFCALLEAFLLVLASRTESLYISYAAYILFGMIYHCMITIAMYRRNPFGYLDASIVAKNLHEDCFALIFGINTLLALVLQSSLTYAVIAVLG